MSKTGYFLLATGFKILTPFRMQPVQLNFEPSWPAPPAVRIAQDKRPDLHRVAWKLERANHTGGFRDLKTLGFCELKKKRKK